MQINITVQAPELVGAIEKLAVALSKGNEVAELFSKAPQQELQSQPTVIEQPAQTTQYVQTHAPEQQVQQAPIAQPQQVTQQPVQSVVPTAQQPAPSSVAPTSQVQPQAVPTTATTYTMDQLAVAATQLADAGKRQEVTQILAAFGVQALMQLPQEQYPAFAAKLRELGAQI